MLGIYVHKKWLESIGDAAHLIVVYSNLKGDSALMMAGERNLTVSSEFVTADVCRMPETGNGNSGAFITLKIPTSAIAAIFDLTEDDSKKLIP